MYSESIAIANDWQTSGVADPHGGGGVVGESNAAGGQRNIGQASADERSNVTAQTLDDNRQIVVSYGDLDLGHAAGQGALRQRVETAATAVCGPAPDLRVLNDWAAFQRCRTAAIRGATPQMDRARLEAQPQLASR